MYWFSDIYHVEYLKDEPLSAKYIFIVSPLQSFKPVLGTDVALYAWRMFKQNPFETLLTNSRSQLSTQMHVYHTCSRLWAVPIELACQSQMGTMWHATSAELVQTAPACCHSATWCQQRGGHWCDHQRTAWVWNPQRPSHHHQESLGILIIWPHEALSRTHSSPCTGRCWIIPLQHRLLTATILRQRTRLKLQRCRGTSSSPGSS
jgi:hypothetical protein